MRETVPALNVIQLSAERRPPSGSSSASGSSELAAGETQAAVSERKVRSGSRLQSISILIALIIAVMATGMASRLLAENLSMKAQLDAVTATQECRSRINFRATSKAAEADVFGREAGLQARLAPGASLSDAPALPGSPLALSQMTLAEKVARMVQLDSEILATLDTLHNAVAICDRDPNFTPP